MLNSNEHKNICIELHNLAVEKDKRYGNSVGKAYEKRGMMSILWRLEDKMNRLETLLENPDMTDNGESIRDNLIDLANYAIFGVLYYDKNKKKNHQITMDEITSISSIPGLNGQTIPVPYYTPEDIQEVKDKYSIKGVDSKCQK